MMFNRLISVDNALESYRKTQSDDAKYKVAAILFKKDYAYNLLKIIEELTTNTYVPLPLVSFKVFEPKERDIDAPEYRDKIVQHMLNNILRDIYEPIFIPDSYACIRGKGNINAIKRLHELQKNALATSENAYLCKVDIKRFFYTIDRDVLIAIIEKHNLLDTDTLNLVKLIIQHSPGVLGLPLGNLTSQLFANILLNEIDQKYRETSLGYLRYADDIFLFCRSKAEAVSYLDLLKRDIVGISLEANHNKSQVFPLMKGFKGLGYRYKGDRLIVSLENRKRVKRRLSSREITKEGFQAWASFASYGNVKPPIRRICHRATHTLQPTAYTLPVYR